MLLPERVICKRTVWYPLIFTELMPVKLITNVTAAAVSNGTTAISFTIEGGSDGAMYDVFATGALGAPMTNALWYWMGQGGDFTNYTIAITSPNAFLILGTPQDTDGDGLTDAYELLVSHTDPHNAYSNLDGILDGWEILLGLNPQVNNFASSSQRSNYGYTPADWAERGFRGQKRVHRQRSRRQRANRFAINLEKLSNENAANFNFWLSDGNRCLPGANSNPGWFRAATEPLPSQSRSSFTARQFRANGLVSSGGVPAVPVAEAITPQIQALADGLQDDPVQIFDYVHDHIKFVLYFRGQERCKSHLAGKKRQ